MRRAPFARAAVAVLLASLVGCTAAAPEADGAGPELALGTVAGRIQVAVPPSPGDVASIHVAVTGADMLAPVGADLIRQADGSWAGSVRDVPPGTGRTVTASASDVNGTTTFSGSTTNVTVYAGSLTPVAIALAPLTGLDVVGANTPPHLTNIIAPTETASNQPITIFAIANDPDTGTKLTYVFSVLSGGGSFSSTTIPNQTPGNAVSTVYTPVAGSSGFAVVQVAVTDGLSTVATTLPIAITP